MMESVMYCFSEIVRCALYWGVGGLRAIRPPPANYEGAPPLQTPQFKARGCGDYDEGDGAGRADDDGAGEAMSPAT